MVCVDILDVSAVPRLLGLSRRGEECKFLILGNGLSGWLALSLLRLFGRTPHKMLSCFDYEDCRNLPEYSMKASKYVQEYIQPQVLKEVSSFGIYCGDELSKVSRFVSAKVWRHSSRAFETLESVSISSKKDVSVLVSCSYVEELTRYAADVHGVKVYSYWPFFRVIAPSRAGFYGDLSRYTTRNLSGFFYFSAALIVFASAIALAAIRLLIPKSKSCSGDDADILALVHQPRPVAGFNDIFWSDFLMNKYGRSVCVVCCSLMPSAGREFYKEHANSLYYLSDFPFFLFRDRSGRPALASILYLRKGLRFLLEIIRSTFLRRGSFWLGATLLRVEARTHAVLAIMRMVGARTTWAMLEGHDINSLAMTLAATRCSGVSMGTSWSMYHNVAINSMLERNHVLFVWGKRSRDIYRDSYALCRHFVMTGYPTTCEYMPPNFSFADKPVWMQGALSTGGRTKIVTFYDNAFARDVIPRWREMYDIYKELLSWLSSRSDVLLILKTKRHSYRLLGDEIYHSVTDFEKIGALYVREEKADLQSGLYADVVIGIGASTLATLSASHGRRCVLFDPYGVMNKNAFPLGLTSVEMATNASDLVVKIDRALDMSSDTMERGGFVDEYADRQGSERIAFFINEVISAINLDYSAEEAENLAVRKYEEQWPCVCHGKS